jgi:hypothetical protein
MNLIMRFIRFLAVSALNVLWRLIAIFFQLILLPLLIAVLRLCSGLVFLSFRATVNGPTRFVDRLAGEWTQRVLDLVDDREHIHEVYQLCRLMVGLMIFLGWVVATFFTVEILRVVFGFFI